VAFQDFHPQTLYNVSMPNQNYKHFGTTFIEKNFKT